VFAVRRLASDGFTAWDEVVKRGFEGLVAKDEASTYEAGRTRRWLKVKKVKQKGWTVGDDRWTRRISVVQSGLPRSWCRDRQGSAATSPGSGPIFTTCAAGPARSPARGGSSPSESLRRQPRSIRAERSSSGRRHGSGRSAR